MIRIFAHRGASSTHPENTVAAFHEAVRVGADAIELDVQLTRDRQLAVFHDETLDRIAGVSGRVLDHSLAAIQEIDIGGRYADAFAGERVPSLRQVLREIPETVLLNIHAIAYSYSRKGLAAELVDALDEVDAWGRCFVTSDAQTLKRIRRLSPGAQTCSLTRFPNPSDYLRHSVELGCPIIQPLRQMVSPEFLAAAHQNGLTVNVVYANTEEEMRELAQMGVDGIFTDHPELLKKVLSYHTT